MDASRLLIAAFVVSLLCIAQIGCEEGPSGEYRTFNEVQAASDFAVEVPDDEAPAAGQADVESGVAETDLTSRIQDAAVAPPSTTPAEGASSPTVDVAVPTAAAEGAAASTDDPNLEVAARDAIGATRPEVAGGADEPLRTGGDDSTVDTSIGSGSAAIPGPAPGSPAGGPPPPPTVARKIELLIPEKSFKSEGPEGALRVSYDDLNLLDILNMDPVPSDAVEYFPDWLNALEGRRIRIRGFMYPAFVDTGIKVFVLVRDNQECCFGPGEIYDHIVVTMREGETTDYIQGRPFDVVGVFRINPAADGPELYELYQIEDAVVIER